MLGLEDLVPIYDLAQLMFSLPHDHTVLTIGLNHANDLMQEKLSKSPPIINLGEHPDGGPIEIKSGRFGSYAQYKKLRASIPKKQNSR